MNFRNIKNLLTIGKQYLPNLVPSAMMSSGSGKVFETLAVSVPKPFVYQVELNRPKNLNAINHEVWCEITECFNDLAVNEDCRAIVVSGSGKLFCAGIDLNHLMSLNTKLVEIEDVARKAKLMLGVIQKYQDSFTSMEKCMKPVICAIHGACIGAGVDLITASDIRYCTADAWFQVKEAALGLAADVGTLQRLPKVLGSDSLVRELCFTARKMHADEALTSGLVSKVFPDKESLINGAIELAEQIASLSPVAVQGTKMSLVYSRDHPVQEGLNHIAHHNKTMLTSEDVVNATMGALSKEKNIQFSKL